MIISLEEAKAHLNITDDADDALITAYIEAAQGFVAGYVDCPMTSADAPAQVKQAVRLLVASLYENRESSVLAANLAVLPAPVSVFDLIGPYRAWVF